MMVVRPAAAVAPLHQLIFGAAAASTGTPLAFERSHAAGDEAGRASWSSEQTEPRSVRHLVERNVLTSMSRSSNLHLTWLGRRVHLPAVLRSLAMEA
jgi:hypothetical protein